MAAPPRHPFTYSNADIVFRSSDNVVYKLHKLVLSLASDFFNDMFELPQPTQSTELNPLTQPIDAQEVDGLPVVPVSEPSSVLTPLFLLCYPLESPDPDLASIAQVRAVLEAAIKYNLRKAQKTTRGRLRELMPSAPLRVYAIACRFGLEDDARDAAEEVRRQKVQDPDKSVEELEEIPFGAYHRLLYYCAIGGGSESGRHFSFCHAITTAGTEAKLRKRKFKKKPQRGPGVVPTSLTPSSTSSSSASVAELPTATPPPMDRPSDPQTSSDPQSPEPSAADDGDIVFVASDGRRLRSAGDAILRGSPVLRALATERSGSTEGIILHVPEPATTMSILIRIYDPFEHVEIINLLDIYNALVGAEKYQMQKAITFLQASLKSRLPTSQSGSIAPAEPLLLYAIACHFGMRDLALLAARATLRTDLTHTLFPAIDDVDISAGYLHRLLDYHRRCRTVIMRIFGTRTWLHGAWLQRVQNAPCAPKIIPGQLPFNFGGQPVRLAVPFPPAKWVCWYEPYIKAAAVSAPWPSRTSVMSEDVLHAGLGVNPAHPVGSVAATSAQPTPGQCHHCMQGKGAVELFQFSQYVASTITAWEMKVNLNWPTVQQAMPASVDSGSAVAESQPGP